MTAPGTAAYDSYELRRILRNRQIDPLIITPAASFSIDAVAGPVQTITITENTTLLGVLGDGQSLIGPILTLIVTQDATGGWTFTFSGMQKAAADVLTAASGAGDDTVYQLHLGVASPGGVLVKRLALDVVST